jgi:exo-beta-1,3-glucanase (GH17 family)
MPHGNFSLFVKLIAGGINARHVLHGRQTYKLPPPEYKYVLPPPIERPNPSSTSSPSSTPTASSVSGGYNPHAMVYSPYNNDTSCKSADQVYTDISVIASHNVQAVRIYATDCNSLSTVTAAVKDFGMKIIQGFSMDDTGVDSIDSQVSDFTAWLANDPSNAGLVELLVVGNEAVSNVPPPLCSRD